MPPIPEELIQQVLDRSDIVEIISSVLRLKPAGKNLKALCPFHTEKTPSFVVNPEKQIFHCFGCGVGGNVITFLMKHDHMTFPEAVRVLADRASIPWAVGKDEKHSQKEEDRRRAILAVNQEAASFFHRTLLTSRDPDAAAARAYVKERRIGLDAVKKFGLGFAPDRWDALLTHLKGRGFSLRVMMAAGLVLQRSGTESIYDRFRNRVMFPIFDYRGRCVAFGGRTLEKDNPAKYINSPETDVYVKGRHLYGLNWARSAIAQTDYVLIVEGYLDCLTPVMQGMEPVVASLGTALTAEQCRVIRRYTTNVFMVFDADVAGENAALRGCEVLLEEGLHVRVVTLEPGQDPDSFVRDVGVEALKERLSQARSIFDFQLELLLRQKDTASVEGRAQVIAGMLPWVSRIPNAVIRSGYVRRLAQRLAVSEAAVLEELKKSSRFSGRSAALAGGGTQRSGRTSVPPAEADFIRLLWARPDLWTRARDVVEPEDFVGAGVADIIRAMKDPSLAGETMTPSVVMSRLQSEEGLEAFANISAQDFVPRGDADRFFTDCLSRLEERRKKRRRQELLAAMEMAREAGRNDKLQELTQEFNVLIKGSLP